MAQSYPRKTLAVFGIGGTTDDFEEFGSTAVSSTNYTKDIETIQGLAAWNTGWRAALVTNKAPVLQDMNAVMLVHSYMEGSIFEMGIPEYDAGTEYSFGSVVKLPYTGGNNFQIFVSLADANTGNALPTAPASNSKWQFVYGFVSGVFTMGTSIAFGATSTEGIVGTATNDDAATGNVGEEVRSSVPGSVAGAATGVYDDGTSISLTAGDWDVSACMVADNDGATWTGVSLGISVTSGNSATGLVNADNLISAAFASSSTTPVFVPMTIPSYRMSLSTTTVVYLKRKFTYSAGTPQADGVRLSARRAR